MAWLLGITQLEVTMFTEQEREATKDWQVYLNATMPDGIVATILLNEFPDCTPFILVMVEKEGGAEPGSPSELVSGTDNLWEWVVDQQPEVLAGWTANESDGVGFFTNGVTDIFLFNKK